MDTDSFTDLALRDLAGETTDAERLKLKAALAAHPERRKEFEELKITHAILRATAPMSAAAKANEPELPAHRLNELRTAVRQHFGPAANRSKAHTSGGLFHVLRWIVAGGGLTALTVLVVILTLSNRTIEVGLYKADLDVVRGDNATLDLPSARLITFEEDAPFDQWQNQSLAWYEHAKIWIDNEHDLIHIIENGHGKVVRIVQPLAATPEGQRDQLKQIVESVQKQ